MELSELKRLAADAGTRPVSVKERKSRAWERSEAVRVYALRRADGTCEGCGARAPFKTATGRPYLEPHHIRRLTDGGADDPASVAGVCPNCHRRAHHAADASAFNRRLTDVIREKEYRVAPAQLRPIRTKAAGQPGDR